MQRGDVHSNGASLKANSAFAGLSSFYAARGLGALAGLLIAGCAKATPGDPVPASRPGLTDDPVVVTPASLQAEAGFEVGRFAGEEVFGGELLVRYGVAPSIEARLGLQSHGDRSDDSRVHALGDPELSFKIALTHEPGTFRSPAISLLPSITLPIGAERYSSGKPEPGVIVLAGWNGAGLEWTGNLGGTAAREDAGRFLEAFVGLAIGRALSERIGLEVEVVRTVETGRHAEGPGLRHAAVGAAWLVHPDLQFDAWAGLRREGKGRRGRFFGLGLSARR
jgi:hypothetical protein